MSCSVPPPRGVFSYLKKVAQCHEVPYFDTVTSALDAITFWFNPDPSRCHSWEAHISLSQERAIAHQLSTVSMSYPASRLRRKSFLVLSQFGQSIKLSQIGKSFCGKIIYYKYTAPCMIRNNRGLHFSSEGKKGEEKEGGMPAEPVIFTF